MCLLCKNPIDAPSTAGCYPVEHLPYESNKKTKKTMCTNHIKIHKNSTTCIKIQNLSVNSIAQDYCKLKTTTYTSRKVKQTKYLRPAMKEVDQKELR
jgi:hypothetical protein